MEGLKCLNVGLISNKHSFSLHKTLIAGLEWCGLLVDYCDVFISCLDSHSDGTHSLQRIHCWASDDMLHFSTSDEETYSSTSWMAWGWVHFQLIFIFAWTIPLIMKFTSNLWVKIDPPSPTIETPTDMPMNLLLVQMCVLTHMPLSAHSQ